MGLEIPMKKKKIIDIDTLIFHDTYDNFPKKPDINDPNVQQRLFYACTGWLGRNPFLNWYLREKGLIDKDEFSLRHKRQKLALNEGALKLAEYTKNEEFALLPDIFSAAWLQLDNMVEEYENLIENWKIVMQKIAERRKTL
jgi:hypothetical protein